MKKLFISSIVFFCGMTVQAQVIREAAVPAVVKAKFASMFPGIKAKKWEKEETKFEASFLNNKENTAVLFDVNGTHIHTEVEIELDALPQAIRNYVAEHFTDTEIDEAGRITAANGTISYKAEIDGLDHFFDANGNLTGKAKDDSEDDEK